MDCVASAEDSTYTGRLAEGESSLGNCLRGRMPSGRAIANTHLLEPGEEEEEKTFIAPTEREERSAGCLSHTVSY